jgi:hypothetical protein
MSSNYRKELRKLVRKYHAKLEKQARSGHAKVRLPNGRFVVAGSSASDCSRALKNLEAEMLRQLAVTK